MTTGGVTADNPDGSELSGTTTFTCTDGVLTSAGGATMATDISALACSG